MDDARYTVHWTDSRDGATYTSDSPLEPRSAAERVAELERDPALTGIHLIPAGHPPLSDRGSEATGGDQLDVDKARLLWEEYSYRHDLIWRLLFRMTFVAALVSTVPLTNEDLNGELRTWVETLRPRTRAGIGRGLAGSADGP